MLKAGEHKKINLFFRFIYDYLVFILAITASEIIAILKPSIVRIEGQLNAMFNKIRIKLPPNHQILTVFLREFL